MLKVGDIQVIKTLRYRQGWSIRRISRELKQSRNTVREVLRGETDGAYTLTGPRARPTGDVITPLIKDYLSGELVDDTHRKQRLTAARIEKLLRERHAYHGSSATVRRAVVELRRELEDPLAVAMVPLAYEPGIDAQVDFLEADVDYPAGRVRKSFLLVRACYSWRAFARSVPAENQEAFFEALMAAFVHFGGVFQHLWFDNLTPAVKKVLAGRAREVQARFAAFQAHYGFEAEFCAPGKGNEKGGVEGGVRYFRRNALSPVPRVAGDAELDALVQAWMAAEDEHAIESRAATIAQLWQAETAHLIPLPPRVFDIGRPIERKVSAFSLVQDGRNFYSVPVCYVRHRVMLKRYGQHIEIHSRDGLIARHARSYGRYKISFDLDHYLPLLARKSRAFDHAAPVRAVQATWPETYRPFLKALRASQGEAEGTRSFIQVLWLHKHHPQSDVHAAVAQALVHASPSFALVAAYVDAKQQRVTPPPLPGFEQGQLPAVHIEVGRPDAYADLCQRGRS